MLTRQCPKCLKDFPVLDFKRVGGDIAEHTFWCKICRRRHSQKRYEARLRETGEYTIERRNQKLRRQYGITQEEFEAKWQDQQASCALCHDPFAKHADAKIDHCHETGKVRGLLCNRCNQGLGYFLDSPALLGNAISYLRSY